MVTDALDVGMETDKEEEDTHITSSKLGKEKRIQCMLCTKAFELYETVEPSEGDFVTCMETRFCMLCKGGLYASEVSFSDSSDE
jgi:hypothetical protein